MISARTKPFWMSEWIAPAACHAVRPRLRCHDWAGLVALAVEKAGGTGVPKPPRPARVEQPDRAAHDAVEAGLPGGELRPHDRPLVVVELRELGLQAGRHRHGRRA